MSKERKKNSDLCAEVRKHLGEQCEVYILQDAFRSGKKPFDFMTMWTEVEFKFLGWEMKIMKGERFSRNQVTYHQYQSFESLNCNCVLSQNSIIGIYAPDFHNILMFITLPIWQKIFSKSSIVSVKFIMHDNKVFSDNATRIPYIHRTKEKLADGTTETIWNVKEFVRTGVFPVYS